MIRQIMDTGGPDAQNIVKRRLVGTIVLTRYNNKTYVVNDVDFNQTPASTF
jgi:aubergine-like protein